MSPLSFYQINVQKQKEVIKRLKSKLRLYSAFRLTIFLLICLNIYVMWGNTFVLMTSSIIGITAFLFLVSKYTDLKKKIRYYKKIKTINEQEIKILNRDLSGLTTGEKHITDNHSFNQDIDLFGQGSIFQLINRTEILKGEELLAKWLNSNDTNDITSKQKNIQELAQKPVWRQHFKASAALIETEISSMEIVNWVENYTSIFPKAFKYLPAIFSSLSIALIALYGLSLFSGSLLLSWFILGVGISSVYIKRITRLYNSSTKMKDTFTQYAELLKSLENENFKSVELARQKKRILTGNISASQHLKSLSNQIDLLANRNNMIFAPLANGFFLWDIHFAFRIETWINEFNTKINDWFEVVAFFDAANSLGNMAYNHPTYTYPLIEKSSGIQIKGKQLGHPLLDPAKMVTNDFLINKDQFFIITGSNMAGKSTFLRTVAVNLVLANCGLPVCAESFQYHPIKLISSMRTTDSLNDETSYFFAELKRLKYIVEAIQEDTYFIILDEILKGTNSKDKAEGSKKFVERLVASNSTGLIATHDLSLCDLSQSLTEVENHYFDADIRKDELYFDYTFKRGICQNMNASFLLNKMGIV